MPKGDELKLLPADIREYLRQAVRWDWSGRLATALVAEGSLDNKREAKPSDFYFYGGSTEIPGHDSQDPECRQSRGHQGSSRRSVALRE